MTNATLFFASVLTFLYLYLSFNVIRQRQRTQQAYGATPEHPDLMRAVRAHGNFQEYTPLFLLLLLLEEARFHHGTFCYLLGAVFLAGRISHAYAFLVHEPKAAAANAPLKEFIRFRGFGMMCTLGSLGVLALVLFVQCVF